LASGSALAEAERQRLGHPEPEPGGAGEPAKAAGQAAKIEEAGG